MSLQAPLLLSIAKAGEKSCNVPNNLSSQPGMAHFPPVSDISATSHSLEVFFTPGIPKAAAVHVTPGRSWTVVLVSLADFQRLFFHVYMEFLDFSGVSDTPCTFQSRQLMGKCWTGIFYLPTLVED